MKAGLFIPRIGPNEAVDAQKIDDIVRPIYEHINGGLSGTSLSPSARLENAKFKENKSLFVLTGIGAWYSSEESSGLALAGNIVLGGISSTIAPAIVSVSWAIQTNANTNDIIIRLRTGTTTRMDISAGTKKIETNVTTFNPPTTVPEVRRWIVGTFFPEYRTSISSGTNINAQILINGSVVRVPTKIWVALSLAHVA